MILKVKKALRSLILEIIGYVKTRPELRNRLKWLAAHFPWLRQRLVSVALNSRESARKYVVPLELENMTPRARQIYQDLKTAIVNKNKGEA